MNLTPIPRRPEPLSEGWHVACLPHSEKKNGQEQQFKTLTRGNNTLTTHLKIPANNEMGIVSVHAQLTTETTDPNRNQRNWPYLRLLFAVFMVLIGSSTTSHGQGGTQKWVFPTGGSVDSSPAIGRISSDRKMTYFARTSGEVYRRDVLHVRE